VNICFNIFIHNVIDLSLHIITSGSRGGGAPGAPLTAADLWLFLPKTLIFLPFFSSLAINFKHNFNRNMGKTRLRLLECNGFTYLKPCRGFKNLLLLKYMPFEDDPPHRFSQFLLFWLYKQDWKFALYSYLGEVIRCNITSL